MKRSVPRLHGPAKSVAKGELIGLPVKVAKSNDAGIVGLSGVVVDETLKTLSLRKDDGRMVQLAKCGSTFSFTVDGQRVDVDGRAIEFRPWDRAKKVR